MPATAAGKTIAGWGGAVFGMTDTSPCRYGLFTPLFLTLFCVESRNPIFLCFRRSDFDPLFKLTNHLVNKVHVSLPSPKTLSVHIQNHCVMGNPIQNCGSKSSVMEHFYPVRESQIRRNDSTHRPVSRCQQLKKQLCAGEYSDCNRHMRLPSS